MDGPAKKLSNLYPKYDQLLNLLDVARYMGEKRNLDDLLRFILEQGIDALDCDRCSIFLHDARKKEIWSKVALGEAEVIRFDEKVGIAGLTISSGKIINIPDAYGDSRFNREIDRQTGYRTRNILSVPMKNTSGVAAGCLQAINKNENQYFTDDDAEFALAFTSQAMVAIESAMLHDENVKIINELTLAQNQLKEKMGQLETIQVIEAMAHESDDLRSFFKILSQKLCEVMTASASSILFEWNEGKWIKFLFDLNLEKKFEEELFNTNKDIEAVIAKYDRLTEVTENDSILKSLDGMLSPKNVSSRILIPFSFTQETQQGEKIKRKGLLQVYQEGGRKFDFENTRFLEIVGGNISAIVQKRMDKDTRDQSGRLATVGQLSSTIFHDFKNPMASIRGIAELIGMSAGKMKAEQMLKFSGIIQSQVDRCVGMIEELLAFTRGEKNFKFKEESLKVFLDGIKDVLEIETERNKLKVEVTCHEDKIFKFDKDKLLRVIFNLTNNAFEILKEGQKVSIDGRVLDDGMVEIRVTDNGPGVPSHMQDTLFEVFVTHGKKGGTGLGLNIARQIVQAHGGEIILDKSYKDGACFVLTLNPDPSAVGGS